VAQALLSHLTVVAARGVDDGEAAGLEQARKASDGASLEAVECAAAEGEDGGGRGGARGGRLWSLRGGDGRSGAPALPERGLLAAGRARRWGLLPRRRAPGPSLL